MVFTPKEQHFAALSFTHFVVALVYVGVTYYLLESSATSPIHAYFFIIIAVLHVGVTMHGCATATKKWDAMTKERHSTVLTINLLPIAVKLMVAIVAFYWEVAAAAVIICAINVLVISVEGKFLRTGVNPDNIEGHVDPTIYEVIRQWFIDMWREWNEITDRAYAGFNIVLA